MKRLLSVVVAMVSLVVLSCSKENLPPQGPALQLKDSLDVWVSAGGVSIGASIQDTTEISVMFAGELVKDSLSTAKSYGLVYVDPEKDSLSSETALRFTVKKVDELNRFVESVDRLTPDKLYEWTVYVETEEGVVLGEPRAFITRQLVAPVVKEVTDISYDEVTFEGTLTPPFAESRNLVYGILYTDDKKEFSNLEGDEIEFEKEDIDRKNRFSVVLDGLEDNAEYYYVPYITLNKVTVYGESGKFETESAPTPGKGVDGEDLSNEVKSPANCYIVTKSGKYKFPAVKGNGKEYVSGGAKAEVLWESFGTSVFPSVGDLVTNAGFKNNYVSFEVPETYREGNAVIAVRNSAGKILWSWHIWLTDQPAECVLPNGAGTIMDRNLGATDKASDRIESYGLLYQWGRKDPFMGEAGWNYVHTASSAGAEWTTNNVEIQGEDYWIANPMDYTAWDVFDETLWEPDKKKRQDPCPAGWRVPACNENDNFWASVAGCLNNSSAFKSTEYGLTLTISTPSTWFPCVGWGTDPFSVTESGGHGYYWLAYYHNHSYAIHNYYSPVLELESMLYHLNCAVRCIKE
ncbi:MAG: hypothetical protein J6J25_01040 [Bacteroidales bacterium]|nr:hypothetical protein [Bacteroidales bacterium]